MVQLEYWRSTFTSRVWHITLFSTGSMFNALTVYIVSSETGMFISHMACVARIGNTMFSEFINNYDEISFPNVHLTKTSRTSITDCFTAHNPTTVFFGKRI